MEAFGMETPGMIRRQRYRSSLVVQELDDSLYAAADGFSQRADIIIMIPH